MRTTLILDDELLEAAAAISDVKGKTALVHAGLRALLEREAQRRLAEAGGTEPKLKKVPRRRLPAK